MDTNLLAPPSAPYASALKQLQSLQSKQYRETFPGAASPLDSVEVVTPEGLNYLDQDIDFGATGVFEVFQNVKFIILTTIWSVPLDREFGIDASFVDKPIPVAELIIGQEIALKINLYEPRAKFRDVSFSGDGLQGHLRVKATIEIDLNAPISSNIPGTIVTKANPTPSSPYIIYKEDANGNLVPWIRGPQGLPGTAATIAVGTTSTLSPIFPATVTNSGSQNAATFNFGIPRGSRWWSGTVDPATVTGSLPGDYYLNVTSGDVFLLN